MYILFFSPWYIYFAAVGEQYKLIVIAQAGNVQWIYQMRFVCAYEIEVFKHFFKMFERFRGNERSFIHQVYIGVASVGFQS